MKFEILHPADQIVMLMQRIYDCGMTTTSGGNLSIKDEEGDIWITPGGIDKGNLTRDDIVCVKPDGTVVGPHKPSIELPFHKKVYDARPEAGAVLHAHPPALVSFSIVGMTPNTSLIPNAHLVCGQVGMAKYDLPGSDLLGKNIELKFREGCNVVIMENHGMVTMGKNLFQAFMRFETLDFCARLEIGARRLGKVNSLNSKQLSIAQSKQNIEMKEFIPKKYSNKERKARREMSEIIHRAYRKKLFTSTQGTLSYKLDKNSFLITPYGVDRMYLEPENIVRIDNGMREEGKIPSRSVLLHKNIYLKHKNINAVMIAHPPNIMSFALSNTKFDTKIIPESYYLLREIATFPFGINIEKPEKIVEKLSDETPIVMIQNDCLIVSGGSLLEVFDRLEVAEFSGKALLDGQVLGPLHPINDEQIEKLKKAFDI